MIKEKYIKKSSEITINILQSKIKSVRKKDIIKTGIRVYKDGFIGIAGGIGDIDEAELEKRAIENLKLEIPYPYEPSTNNKMAVDYRLEVPSNEEFIEEVEKLLEILRKEFPDFIFSNNINIQEIETQLSNNKGLDLVNIDRMVVAEIIIKEKKSISVFDAYSISVDRTFNGEQILSNTREILNAYRNKVELPSTGTMPVAFLDMDLLPFKKLIMELDGYKVGTGASLFTDFIGEKKFNENFTLYQSAKEEDKRGAEFFDAEGVVNEGFKYPLIKNGRIITPYTDKKTAAQFDLPLTGSASAAYDKVPSLTHKNYSIDSSNKTLKELLDGKLGVLSFIASGGDFSQEGAFGTPVQLAFLTDGEKLIGRLPELNLSGEMYTMFGDGFKGKSTDELLAMKATVFDLNVELLK